MVKEEIRIKIKELINRYKGLEETRSKKEMNVISEADVRADFVDPLFKALGWDVKNIDEYDREHYIRKVGHADIALKLKKEPVVFIEAKRFGGIEDVSKRGEADWMDAERQVMNYALGKGIKWAVLTNFEKFRLFNAFNGFTVLDIKAYWEFEERLDDLLYLTKDSLEIGYINKLERREERPDVDYKFLESLNRWRLKLANDIYYNNYANEEQYKKELEDTIKNAQKLTDQRLKKFKIEVAKKKLSEVDYSLLKDEIGDLRIDLLKSAVQRILDRLVIIRYAEDKLILDNPDQLRALYESWQSTKKYTSLFGSLKNFFIGFNEIHDSSIFEVGHICEKMKLSDELLGEIINELYEVNFRKFDFDILGNTYETYLGHTLNITDDDNVELVSSHEKRKESGIYYTPPYVVDYIVKNTVGEVINGMEPRELKKIRVLDPACGSGSFLIKAYDYFDEYFKKENERIRREKQKKIKEFLKNNKNQITFKDEDMINFEEHTGYETEILQNNIFGVDLDEQAAEIASVNLVLKTLKKKETLPLILGHTVMVGNSLISGTEEELKIYFGDNLQEVMPFTWEEEFAQVMDEGGFNVVIGNPPWGAKLKQNEKDYLEANYQIQKQNMNSFELFLRRGLKILNENGTLGFIVPRNFIRQGTYTNTRKLLLESFKIKELIDFKKFPEVTQEFIGILISKPSSLNTVKNNLIKINGQRYIKQSLFLDMYNYVFNLNINDAKHNLIMKIINQSKPFDSYVDIVRGIEISKRGGVIQCSQCKKWHVASKKEEIECRYCGKDIIVEDAVKDKLISENETKLHTAKIVTGEDIGRYSIKSYHYFDSNREGIELKNLDFYKCPKIIMRAVDINPTVLDIDENFYVTKNVYSIRPKKDHKILPYLICITNSSLMKFYNENMFLLEAEITIFFPKEYLVNLPIKPLPYKQQKPLIALANRMLSLNKQLHDINTDFSHYINLHPRKKDMKLEEYLKQISDKDKEVLKDGSGTSANKLEGKIKNLEIREEGDCLIFKIGYLKKTQKGTEIVIEFDAFKIRISDKNLRKFIYYSIQEFITSGKLGKGNLIDRVFKMKLPCFNSNNEENKKIIDKIMEPFLDEVTKKEKIEKEIAGTDKTIDQKVYKLYGLTEEEIKIVEESLKR